MLNSTPSSDIALKLARSLIRIGAVHYFKDQPFTFTSGTLSPVYVDCRMPISFVAEREELIESALEILKPLDFDYVAGGETAGIPYASFLAARLRKPLVYVRKRRKGFGRDAQIEGVIPKGARTLLVEDLMFDGKSKLHFCLALREAGVVVDSIFSVFDYGIASSKVTLAEHSVTSLSLTNWRALLQVGTEDGVFTPEQARVVLAFLENPASWSA
jgi:orotate phosphoribosyltransferase